MLKLLPLALLTAVVGLTEKSLYKQVVFGFPVRGRGQRGLLNQLEGGLEVEFYIFSFER